MPFVSGSSKSTFELQVFFVDFPGLLFGQFPSLSILPLSPSASPFVQVDVRSHVRETVAGIYDGKAEEVLFQAEVSFRSDGFRWHGRRKLPS